MRIAWCFSVLASIGGAWIQFPFPVGKAAITAVKAPWVFGMICTMQDQGILQNVLCWTE